MKPTRNIFEDSFYIRFDKRNLEGNPYFGSIL